MSAAATILYVWSTVQDLAVTLFSAIVIIAMGLGLWYADVWRRRKNAKKREGVSHET